MVGPQGYLQLSQNLGGLLDTPFELSEHARSLSVKASEMFNEVDNVKCRFSFYTLK